MRSIRPMPFSNPTDGLRAGAPLGACLALLALTVGCRDVREVDDDGTGGRSSFDAVSSTAASPTSTSSTSTATAASTAASTSSGGSVCGDGQRDPGEACDDGNTLNGDGCRADCTLPGAIVWERFDNGGQNADDDVASGVAVGPDGSIFVVGTETTADGTDLVLLKYDASGALVWKHLFDGMPGWGSAHAADYGSEVAVDANGRAIVVGGTQTESESATSFIQMVDADGNTLWTRTGDFHWAWSVAFDADGNAVVAAELGNEPLWARLDTSQGTVLQEVDMDVASEAVPQGIAVDTSGNVIIAGFQMTEDGTTGNDAVLYKYGSDGTLLWSRVVDGGAGSSDSYHAVDVDGGGRIYAAGTAQEAGLDLRFDGFEPSGQSRVLQPQMPGHRGEDQGTSIHIDDQGAIILCGYVTGANGQDSAWLRQISDEGAPVWTRQFDDDPSLERSFCNDVTTHDSGEIVMVGSARFSSDVWVVKVAY